MSEQVSNQVSLIDTFMPDDLCARCNENEADTKIKVSVKRGTGDSYETARLAFCSPECKTAFVVAFHSIGKFPVG